MMSAVGAKDTAPELYVRRELFATGFRYRLHVAGLAGKPDVVLPRYRTAVFVHGCFWHGHRCARGKRLDSDAGNVSEAARRLGVSRGPLYRRLAPRR